MDSLIAIRLIEKKILYSFSLHYSCCNNSNIFFKSPNAFFQKAILETLITQTRQKGRCINPTWPKPEMQYPNASLFIAQLYNNFYIHGWFCQFIDYLLLKTRCSFFNKYHWNFCCQKLSWFLGEIWTRGTYQKENQNQ